MDGFMMGLLIFGVSTLIIMFVVLPIIGPFVGKAMAKKEAEKEAEKKQQRERQEKQKIALVVYKRMVNDFRISKINTQNDENKLLTVVQVFRPESTLEEAKEIFQYGEELMEEDKEREFQKKRKPELDLARKQYEEVQLFGKEKYTYMAKAKRVIDTTYDVLRRAQISGAYNQLLNTRAEEPDWAFWGGIADGLAGTGAGIATASFIQAQNAKASANAAQMRADAVAALDYYHNNPIDRLHIETESDTDDVAYIESRLFSANNQDEWFKSLKFSDVTFEITEGKNFIVQGKISCPNSFKLCDRISVLDGSIEVSVRNKTSGQIVATGYFSAPGAANLNLLEVGFCSEFVFQAICICDQYSDITSGICLYKYECEFKPHKLWLIEL